MRQQYTWGDIAEAKYRAERQEIERQIASLTVCSTNPIQLPNLERSAKLLKDVGGLFNHPGVTDERRKEFIEEVFESVQLDEYGIRAVLPAEEYRPLVAVAEVGGNGAGDGGRTRDPLLREPRLYRAAPRVGSAAASSRRAAGLKAACASAAFAAS